MFRGRLRIIFSDSFSIAFVLACIFSVFAFEVLVVLPATSGGAIPNFVHITLGTVIFLNILGNLSKTMFTDTTTRKMILPTILKPEWRFCFSCEANSPPRAFHCDRCKACVLRRDHHCPFAGCCVGLKNFRFYLTFLFYLALGAMYASYFNMFFIWEVLGGLSFFSVCVHTVPFLFFVLGYLTFWVFLCTLMSVLSLVGFMFVTNLFVLHLQQMLRNQTTFEKNNRITSYDLGWRRNLEEFFGAKWKTAWLFPFIQSPLPSDGMTYSTNLSGGRPSTLSNTNSNVRQRHL